MVVKKRKMEVNDVEDGDDICIIENNENNDVHHETSSEQKKLTEMKKIEPSEDSDCLIVYDDKNSD